MEHCNIIDIGSCKNDAILKTMVEKLIIIEFCDMNGINSDVPTDDTEICIVNVYSGKSSKPPFPLPVSIDELPIDKKKLKIGMAFKRTIAIELIKGK